MLTEKTASDWLTPIRTIVSSLTHFSLPVVVVFETRRSPLCCSTIRKTSIHASCHPGCLVRHSYRRSTRSCLSSNSHSCPLDSSSIPFFSVIEIIAIVILACRYWRHVKERDWTPQNHDARGRSVVSADEDSSSKPKWRLPLSQHLRPRLWWVQTFHIFSISSFSMSRGMSYSSFYNCCFRSDQLYALPVVEWRKENQWSESVNPSGKYFCFVENSTSH